MLFCFSAYADSEGPNNPSTMADDDTVGTTAWTNPDNAKASDDSYVIITNMWQIAEDYDNEVRIVKSDGSIGSTNKAIGGTWPFTLDIYYSYGSSSDLWGETWTVSDINNANFGVVLSVQGDITVSHYLKATNFGFSIPSGATINGILVEIERNRNDSGAVDDAYVDHIRITVTYTEAVAPPPSAFIPKVFIY